MTTSTPIQQRFSHLQQQGRCALMPFLMAGDPDLATTRAPASAGRQGRRRSRHPGERVGSDNFFLFGHTAAEVQQLVQGGYHPLPWLERNDQLKAAMDLIGSGHFSEGDRDLFRPLLENLIQRDPFLVVADASDYSRAQNGVDTAWRDSDSWVRSSMLNCLRCGFFSSDRAIKDYAQRIWALEPHTIGNS